MLNRTGLIVSAMVIVLSCITLTAHSQVQSLPQEFNMWAMQGFFGRAAAWPAMMQKPGMQVIMVGTGIPLYSPDRKKASVAIIAGGRFLLFDTGNDSTRTMEELNLPINLVDNIFLTHYHGDHVADLGSFINQTWIGGRQNKIDVYGPSGANLQVAGFALAGLLDKNIWRHSDLPLTWLWQQQRVILSRSPKTGRLLWYGARRIRLETISWSRHFKACTPPKKTPAGIGWNIWAVLLSSAVILERWFP